MEPITALVDKLCESSQRNFHNVYDYVKWPDRVEADREWFMSPELCSLHGTEVWELLEEPTRKRLAFYEAVNFFSLNVRGESALMQGLAQRLYGARFRETSRYLHHFLDEENKHSVLFGTFCEKYAGKVYSDRKVVASGELAHGTEGDFLFFAKVLVFEELVDRYNLAMSKDARIHPVAVAINRNHHVEEARHLSFGRRICGDLWEEGSRDWSEEQREAIVAYVRQFFVMSWREYYNPDVYRDAGLEQALRGRWEERNPWQLMRFAWEHPASRARRATMSEKCARFLTQMGMTMEAIAP